MIKAIIRFVRDVVTSLSCGLEDEGSQSVRQSLIRGVASLPASLFPTPVPVRVARTGALRFGPNDSP